MGMSQHHTRRLTYLLFAKHHSTPPSSVYLNPGRVCHWEQASRNRGDTTIWTTGCYFTSGEEHIWFCGYPSLKVPLLYCSMFPIIILYKRLIWAAGPVASLRAHTWPATLPHEDPSRAVGEGEVPACWGITERALFSHETAKLKVGY